MLLSFYFYLVLVNALVSFAAGAAVWWRNRNQAVGPLLGSALLLNGVWLIFFGHYFRPMEEAPALLFAQLTLSLGILTQPVLMHAMTALGSGTWRPRWWVIAGYVSALVFLVCVWTGQIVAGVKTSVFMQHYIQYHRKLYPLLGLHLVLWQWLGVGSLARNAWLARGYKRTQLTYFIVAWFTQFLTLNTIILPLEYDISIVPFGFFLLPLNMAFLAYVMSRARLADFNVVISRVLLHSVTLLIVVGVSVLFIGGIMYVSPKLMSQEQAIFTLVLVTIIALALTVSLPRLLPRAERMMQERMFGGRYGYQDALAGLVQEIGHLANLDELLQRAVTTVHSQMQLSRVMILMQDSLSGHYRLQAESGLPGDEATEGLRLNDNSVILRWLSDHRDTLVRDEIQRTEEPATAAAINSELDRLKVAVCVPMVVEDQVVGVVCLGTKANNEMFFVSDLKVLETLATEVGLAVKYRRMEEQIFRKNKLIELGTIAAGVAHEIRNPLASIRTFAQLLPSQIDDPEFKQEFSKLVLKDVDRITKVIESMLAFARPAQVLIGDHKATELVDEAVLLVQARLKSKRIELTREFHEEPSLRVDRQQILQVLVNLLSNAADALPEHGKIRVATGVRMLESEQTGNGSDRYAVIEVADNGPGIPPIVRNRIFDPFFTTKKEGTGLGLSISQKIARDHGGIITVSSVEGKGTTFQVNLPVAA